MEKDYKIYKFIDRGYGDAWVIAKDEKTAVQEYESDVNHGSADERYEEEYNGGVYKPRYRVIELTEEQLDEVEILEPCGGLWTNPATKVMKERLSKGQTLPFVLCEKQLED